MFALCPLFVGKLGFMAIFCQKEQNYTVACRISRRIHLEKWLKIEQFFVQKAIDEL